VFIVCIIEFLVVDSAATSVFFFVMMGALIDVVAGLALWPRAGPRRVGARAGRPGPVSRDRRREARAGAGALARRPSGGADASLLLSSTCCCRRKASRASTGSRRAAL